MSYGYGDGIGSAFGCLLVIIFGLLVALIVMWFSFKYEFTVDIQAASTDSAPSRTR